VTLRGINFVRRSVVQFKRKAVPTQVLGPTELKFTLDADAQKAAGRFDLVVINPAPVDTFYSRGMWGNGTSNPCPPRGELSVRRIGDALTAAAGNVRVGALVTADNRKI